MADTNRFPCFLVSKQADGAFRGEIAERSVDDLPAGDVLVRVAYSSLNYKDALSATGNPGVTRKFPHVPGIDAAGTVEAGTSPAWKPGDAVIITGHDLGQNTWGGMAGYVRVPAAWLVRSPQGLTARDAMSYGTAGLTAAQCVEALIARGIGPERGEIVVTGASGGVGSVAVGILAKLGYRVAAVSGKPEASEPLKKLGAATILSRSDVDDKSGKPLLAQKFAGAVDTVGGNTLSTLVRSLHRGGVLAACGLVGGTVIPLTVFPFILRGIDLVGIDSVECPQEQRERIWSNLSGAWRVPALADMTTEIPLNQVPEYVERILKGGIIGRTVIQPTK
jgi:putative YhdH/YhfP family quinone oxidoreductase